MTGTAASAAKSARRRRRTCGSRSPRRTADDTGRVVDRLASAELELGGADADRHAAETGDRRSRTEARAGRGLGEVADDRVAVEQPGWLVAGGAVAALPRRAGARASSCDEVGDAQQVLHASRPFRCDRGHARPFHGAAHAPRPAAARPSSMPAIGDDLDAGLAQLGVGVDVALVRDDDTRRDREHVVAVVPLLPLGLHRRRRRS